MLEDCEIIIIAVGSAQKSGTIRNPLSFEFRKRLIEETYSDCLDRIRVIPIKDREKYSDDASWGDYLFQQIYEQCNLKPTVIYEGFENERRHWYDSYNIPVILISRQQLPISGTDLRRAIKADYKKFVLPYLPNAIHKHYDLIRKEIQNASSDKKCN